MNNFNLIIVAQKRSLAVSPPWPRPVPDTLHPAVTFAATASVPQPPADWSTTGTAVPARSESCRGLNMRRRTWLTCAPPV